MKASKLLIELFNEIELVDRKDDLPYHYIPVIDQNNTYTATYFLRFPTTLEVTPEKIPWLIRDRLNGSYHLLSDEISYGLLVLFSLCRKNMRSPEKIGKFWNLITPVKIKQYLFFDVDPDEQIFQLNFFDYTIGAIDYKKFIDFLDNHAQTDYATRYRNTLEKRPGIEVKPKTIAVVDIYHWLTESGINTTNLPEGVQDRVNIYLKSVSNEQFKHFKEDFNQQQSFVTAYFGVIYDLEDLEQLGCTFINLFFGFGNHEKRGWLQSTKMQMTSVGFPDPRILQPVNVFLRKNNEFMVNGTSTFFRCLKIVSEILAGGERHIVRRNLDQAYIDFFVALDFLLAPDTKESKKLKRRIAFLIYKFFNRSLADQIERLDILYKLRNNYVHNGVRIELPMALELRDITKVIIAILFNQHKRNITNSKYTYDDWIKSLDDHLERFFNKGVEPNQKGWVDLGVTKLNHVLLHSDHRAFGNVEKLGETQ